MAESEISCGRFKQYKPRVWKHDCLNDGDGFGDCWPPHKKPWFVGPPRGDGDEGYWTWQEAMDYANTLAESQIKQPKEGTCRSSQSL